MTSGIQLPRVMFICDYEYCGTTERWLETLSALNTRDWKNELAVQVRIKNQPADRYRELAELAKSVLPAQVRTLLNGDAHVASVLGYDGVHLPQKRLETTQNLTTLSWVSIAIHHASDLQYCELLGAHSVVVAPILQTQWKTVNPLGYAKLRRFTSQSIVPVYALGGINLNNVEKCLTTGVYGIAVLSSVFKTGDPIQRLEQFLAHFDHESDF